MKGNGANNNMLVYMDALSVFRKLFDQLLEAFSV